jgi:hypothetical protein
LVQTSTSTAGKQNAQRWNVDLSKPIDANDPEAVTLLAGIQGNLLKTHGRDHTAHVFVRFAPTKAPPRKWISSVPVTSAADQAAQTSRFRLQGGRGEPFADLLLAHAGYKALGIAAEQTPEDAFFVVGLAAHNSVGSDPINDPPSTAWEPAFRDGRFDFGPPRGLLAIEHFGHQDGISDPVRPESGARIQDDEFCEAAGRRIFLRAKSQFLRSLDTPQMPPARC